VTRPEILNSFGNVVDVVSLTKRRPKHGRGQCWHSKRRGSFGATARVSYPIRDQEDDIYSRPPAASGRYSPEDIIAVEGPLIGTISVPVRARLLGQS
jgi:hypothetical protein